MTEHRERKRWMEDGEALMDEVREGGPNGPLLRRVIYAPDGVTVDNMVEFHDGTEDGRATATFFHVDGSVLLVEELPAD